MRGVTWKSKPEKKILMTSAVRYRPELRLVGERDTEMSVRLGGPNTYVTGVTPKLRGDEVPEDLR